MSMFRDIPSLSVICLKAIAKQPTIFISNDSLHRALNMFPDSAKENHLIQTIITYIAEAGRLSDDVVPVYAFNSNWTSLCLRNSKVSGSYIIKIINTCCNIKELDISGCFLVDDDTISKVLQKCRQLSNLDVCNCRKLTDNTITHIINYGRNITSINIGGNFNITLTGIQNLIESYPEISQLNEINISGLPITPPLLLSLVRRNNKCLHSIGIGYASLTETFLKQFLDVIKLRIRKLNIAWVTSANMNDLIGADFTEYLSHICPKLQDLDITGCKNITVTSIQQMIDYKKQQVCVCLCKKFICS